MIKAIFVMYDNQVVDEVSLKKQLSIEGISYSDGIITAVDSNELKRQLETEIRINEDLERLLKAIPQCNVHGRCIPHAIEWIEKVKTLGKVINNE